MGTEIIAIIFTIAITIATSIPLGRYMARVFSGERTLLDPLLLPTERLVLGVTGIKANDPAEGQDWRAWGAIAACVGVLALCAAVVVGVLL